jgi:N-acyl-L-homoserine lactone synthetase
MITLITEECSTAQEAGKQDYRSVVLQEEDIVVRTITKEIDWEKAGRLRHEIFCNELKWVLHSENGLESDEYDNCAVFFGVFDKNDTLLAFLRLILPGRQFMMEKEFRSLVHQDHIIRKLPDTAEISRLCVAPDARTNGGGNFGVHRLSLVLFTAVYQWCLANGIRYLYAVTELKIYRLYCIKGFPYKLIGGPENMPDGVTIVAVMMDWDEFEQSNAVSRPELAAWFRQGPGCLLPRQSQQHGSCSTRSASA